MEKHYHESHLRDLASAMIESYFLNRKPHFASYEKTKLSSKITKALQTGLTKDLILTNAREIVHFMSYAKHIDGAKDIVRDLFKAIMPQSRSFVGTDLVNLFKVIDKYGMLEEVPHILINVAPNLMTIQPFKQIDYTIENTKQAESGFASVNESHEREDKTIKRMILKKYEALFRHKPELLKLPEASLNPLSFLMAELFETYTDEEVILCLQLLGSDKVDNYHETFIKKLYDRYSP